MKHGASESQRRASPAGRDDRIPLFVQVVVQPSFGDCWSMNISRGGMALEVDGDNCADAVTEGSRVELEFSLPDTGSRLRARSLIAWREAQGSDRAEIAFGVQFLEMSPQHRALLVRYVQEYRFRITLASTDAREIARMAGVLEEIATVFPASTESQLDEILSRGDVSAVVLLGEDEASATAWGTRCGGDASRAGRTVRADRTPRVVYAARGAPEHLVRLHNAGLVYQSLPHPPDATALKTAVLRACEDFAVRTELRRVSHELERALLRERARERVGDLESSPAASKMVAASDPMRAALSLLQIAAPEKVHVLLEGETGTGKELLARALHEMSDRANAPFVTQDCGALTETLLESELFGHVRGAFTGATTDHPGLFLTAEGGTIFLDEIENTSLSLQAKLLRVIETGEVRPVGGTQRRRVDVRVVVASNRELVAEVAAGRFRSDLYYRLNVFPVHVASLRSRRADILPLARCFLERAGARFARPRCSLSPDAEMALLRHEWPGNVRELRNTVERAVLLSSGPVIGAELLLGCQEDQRRPVSRSLAARLREAEREILREELQAHGGVLRRAARALETDPVTLGRKARRHGLWPSKETTAARGRHDRRKGGPS